MLIGLLLLWFLMLTILFIQKHFPYSNEKYDKAQFFMFPFVSDDLHNMYHTVQIKYFSKLALHISFK